MSRSRIYSKLLIIGLLGCALVACKQNDSTASNSGGPGGGSGGGSSTGFVLPYFDAGDSGGAIKLVDSDSPATTPVVADSGFGVTDVESGAIDTRVIDTYSIDSINGGQSNVQPALVTYAKNGTLYKIDLSRGVSHTPQQFSSLSTVCALVNEFGDGTLDGSYLVVQSLNASGQCAQNTVLGDTLSLVKVTASTADAGIALNGRAIEDEVIGSSGTITGFLVKETLAGTDTLRAEDVNLANPVDLLTLASGTFFDPDGGPFIPGTGLLDYFTAQADGAANPALYRFNPGSNSAPKIEDLAGQADGSGVPDSSDYYYVNGSTLNKVAHDSTTPSVLLTRTLASGESLNIAGLSPTRLVFTDTGGANASLETLLKDGSGPVTVDSASFTAPNSTSFNFAALSGERLFYTQADTTNSSGGFSLSQSARQAMTDGTGVVTTASNAFWSGVVIQSTTTIDKLILTALGAGSTAHLTAYSAVSGTQVTDIGTANNVDSGFGGPFQFGTFGDKGLFGYSPVGASDNDTYFFDAGTDNSLLGVGTQAGINETPIVLSGF